MRRRLTGVDTAWRADSIRWGGWGRSVAAPPQPDNETWRAIETLAAELGVG